MPIYSYRGIDRTGKEVKATINVDSVILAKQKLKTMGIMLIDIKENSAKKEQNPSSFSGLFQRVSVDDLAMMTRQLATLIKAKIQIVESLAALEDQVENPQLRVVLSTVKQDVNEGSSLAQAMAKHPQVFNHIFVNMVEAGEASGTLEIVLLRLADFTESQMKLKNKIKGAMTYPVVMAIFGLIMMNVIFIFVIPKIAKIFTSMKTELPLATKIAIGLSNFLQSYWWLVIIGSIASFISFNRYINTTKGKRVWDKFVLKTPIIGKLVNMINVSRFCSTLATLLHSGVPILTAMNIVKNLIGNIWMQEAVERARAAVSEGSSMAPALKESGHFPSLVTHMIVLGERSGEIEEMLKIISENYEDQVESKISGLTSVLEPIMMVGMGLAVGFIVMAVIVPMMKMSSLK